MAFIPGYQHDCFLSYDHRDAAWVSAFRKRLTEVMNRDLGIESQVWQDKDHIRTGQDFPAVLESAIRASTAFVAVLSRSYQQNPEYCGKELAAFLKESENASLETGGYGRLLKVVRYPWHDDAHLGFHKNYQFIPFFKRDQDTGYVDEFKPSSAPFQKAIEKLSQDILKLFEAILRGMDKIFVARPTPGAAEERNAIAREIRAAGYALSPPPLGAIPEVDIDNFKNYINEARATVHVLGPDFHPSVRHQIDLSLDAGKRVIFCLTRDADSAAGDQKALIDQIRNNAWNLPHGAWDFLDSRSPAVRLKDLLGVLAQHRADSPAAAPPAANKDAKRLYLLCDPTTPEDAGFARQVQTQIREKETRIQVDLPPLASDSLSPGTQHERLLHSCDGLLLYREKAPNQWFNRNFMDLVTAPDLKSRAMLLRNENVAYPGVTVIQRHDPFDLNQLEPFLASLRDAKPGAAYAGS